MKQTNLPQMMYAVAVVLGGMVFGQVYGPYNRLQDAEKALARIQARKGDQDKYQIIYSSQTWVTYIR